jgi:hypothetical protein
VKGEPAAPQGVAAAQPPQGVSLRTGGVAFGSGGKEHDEKTRSSVVLLYPLSPRSGRHPLRERSDRHPLKPRSGWLPLSTATPPERSGTPPNVV